MKLSWVAPLALLASVSTLADPVPSQTSGSDSQGWVAIGHASRWFGVDLNSGRVERLEFPPDLVPTQATLTGDGSLVVFTAFSTEAQNQLLYQWRRDSKSVKRLGETRGFHSDPSISSDNQWVYFAHHPNAGGPPGAHGPKAYAQVYRARLDGSQLEALTAEPGCHIAPVSPGGDNVIFIHSDCGRSRILRSIAAASRSSPGLRHELGAADQLTLSPDGRFLAVRVQSIDTSQVLELDLHRRTLNPRLLFEARKEGHAGFIRHGSHRGEVLFLQGTRLLWIRSGRACELTDLESPKARPAKSTCRELTPSETGFLTLARSEP